MKIEARLITLIGDSVEDDTHDKWKDITSRLLRRKNIMTLKRTEYKIMQETTRTRAARLVKSEKHDIFMSDTILAKCINPSWSTAMAIQFAWSLQKNIIVVTNSKASWLHEHATHIFPTMEEAIEPLVFPEFDPGTK